MDSSHHVFLAPRVQLNVHVAQTSMLSLDVRSPRSDVECRGGDRQGSFNRTHRNFMSVLPLRVNIGFTQPLVLLSSFVLSRIGATICLLERVYGSRSRIDPFGTVDPKLAFPS